MEIMDRYMFDCSLDCSFVLQFKLSIEYDVD